MIIPALLRDSPWRRNPEVDRLARLIVPPLKPNHRPRHASLGSIIALKLDDSAKLFEFGETSVMAAMALIKRPRRQLEIIRTARAPANKCFFEFDSVDQDDPHHHSIMGLMTEGDLDRVKVTGFQAEHRPSGWIVAPTMQCTAPLSFPDQRQLDVTTFLPGIADEHLADMQMQAFRIVAAIWAFLATPGVVTVTNVISREGRIARRRGFGLSAIDSYNRVTLNVPGDHVINKGTTHFTRGPGVRRHDVLGHERLRRRPPPGSSPLTRWLYAWWFGKVRIDPYERGDERLGVVFKERKIKAAKPGAVT